MTQVVLGPKTTRVHNELDSLQGGAADEYYHLDSADHSELTNWLGAVALAADGGFASPNGSFALNTGGNDKDFVFGDTNVSGNGTKIGFDFGKRAFRAGSAAGGVWDSGNIGDYSFASGYNIKASGMHSFAQGGATHDSVLVAADYGAFAQGYSYYESRIEATSKGAFAQGSTYGYYEDLPNYGTYIRATNRGAFAQGYVYNYTYYNGGSTKGFILASGLGSFAQGRVDNYCESDYNEISIKATSKGAFAQGSASNYYSYDAIIEASNYGTFAQGEAYAGNSDASVKATGRGAFAHGRAKNKHILASGSGAGAFGYAYSGNIEATAKNAFQFGQGSNGLQDSLQVGSQMRLKGTTGAPGAGSIHNGDIWVDNNYVYIRSNGSDVKIT